MKFTWFIGIDVSKLTLDVAFCHQANVNQFTYHQFENSLTGFKSLMQWLNKQKVDAQDSLLCMEHTGHYTLALCCFLQENLLCYNPSKPATFEKITRYHSR